MPAGYSTRPLAEKLGYTPGMRVWFSDMPDSVRAEIRAGVEGHLSEEDVPAQGTNAAHIFVTDYDEMETELRRLVKLIEPSGMIWVSWPKRGADTETDITEDRVRDAARALELVDIKVCAVNDDWAGLKLVRR